MRLPTMTITHGPSPAPTKTCWVHGGQWTKSQAFRRTLLALDHEHALAGDDEEVLLAALAVVDAPLTRPHDLDAEAELRPLLPTLEVGVLPALLASDP